MAIILSRALILSKSFDPELVAINYSAICFPHAHRVYRPSGEDLCYVEECPYCWALPAPGVLVPTAKETFASISAEESTDSAQFCVLDSKCLFSRYTCFWSVEGMSNCENVAVP